MRKVEVQKLINNSYGDSYSGRDFEAVGPDFTTGLSVRIGVRRYAAWAVVSHKRHNLWNVVRQDSSGLRVPDDRQWIVTVTESMFGGHDARITEFHPAPKAPREGKPKLEGYTPETTEFAGFFADGLFHVHKDKCTCQSVQEHESTLIVEEFDTPEEMAACFWEEDDNHEGIKASSISLRRLMVKAECLVNA